MKFVFMLLAAVLLLMVPQISFASVTQYPNPYRQTMWNDVTDSIHTLGQSPEEASLTKKKLHQKRTQARLKSINAAQWAKIKAKRQAWLASQ